MGDSPSVPRLPRPGCNAAPAAPQTPPRPQHRSCHNRCLILLIIISAIASGGTKSQPTLAPASSSPASSSAPAPTASATVKVVLTARQRHFVKDIQAQFALTRSASAIAAIGRQVCTLRRDGMRQGDVVAQLSVTAHQAAVTRLAERDLCRRYLPKPPRPKPAPPSPAPSATSAPQPAGCYPRASSGNCYEPGEFCPHADAGMTGVAGDGEKIICRDNNGLRWEPI
jgi:hypothetical protein